MGAARQSSDDMTHTAVLVGDVLNVDAVTRLAMASTEVRVSCSVGPLHFNDEAVDEENHLIVASLSLVVWILQSFT